MDVKFFCCGKEVELEELPANYGHQYEGKCSVCGKTWGIEHSPYGDDDCEDEIEAEGL